MQQCVSPAAKLQKLCCSSAMLEYSCDSPGTLSRPLRVSRVVRSVDYNEAKNRSHGFCRNRARLVLRRCTGGCRVTTQRCASARNVLNALLQPRGEPALLDASGAKNCPHDRSALFCSMPLSLEQQARIARKKQDALDRKRQKEDVRDAKRRRLEEAAAPAPAAAPPSPPADRRRGTLEAHNGAGLREAPLHARRRSVPVRRFSAETPPLADDAPRAPTAPAPAPAPPAAAVPPGTPGVAATPSSGAMAWVLASDLAAAETGPAATLSAPAAAPRAVTESPPAAAAREPVAAPASPLRFDEASDDDAAAPEPAAAQESDDDSVVFLGSNAAAPPPAPAPAPAPASVPVVDGPRCGHGKLATEHCSQCAAFNFYEVTHGMIVQCPDLKAEGAPPPPSEVIVGRPRASLDKAEECVVCMDNVGSMVLNPCAHRVCGVCAKQLGECPMCRSKLTGFRGGAAFMPVGSPAGREIVAVSRGEVPVPAPAPDRAPARRPAKPRNCLERWVGAAAAAKKPAPRRKKR